MPYRLGPGGELYSNSVMGTFAESLSPYFNKIILMGFTAQTDSPEINYQINIGNIIFINLGPEGQFWDYFKKIKNLKKSIKNIEHSTNDILLLRAPSPLTYVIWKYFGCPKKTVLLLIGNPQFTDAYFRKNIFQFVFRKMRSEIQNHRLKYICKNTDRLVLVNSDSLNKIWKKILGFTPKIINTSSISKKDICIFEHTKNKVEYPCNLLFVGRICFDKGIRELLEAIKALNTNINKKYFLKLVGPVGDLNGVKINDFIQNSKVEKYVDYNGPIQFGPKLFNFYKKSHIYILPSYHEGMPKTVWESMANGTPVIASKIDGIKDNFRENEDIIFIKPRSANSIVSAVQKITSSNSLYLKLIKNGLAKSKYYTRESQANQIVEMINEKYKLYR